MSRRNSKSNPFLIAFIEQFIDQDPDSINEYINEEIETFNALRKSSLKAIPLTKPMEDCATFLNLKMELILAKQSQHIPDLTAKIDILTNELFDFYNYEEEILHYVKLLDFNGTVLSRKPEIVSKDPLIKLRVVNTDLKILGLSRKLKPSQLDYIVSETNGWIKQSLDALPDAKEPLRRTEYFYFFSHLLVAAENLFLYSGHSADQENFLDAAKKIIKKISGLSAVKKDELIRLTDELKLAKKIKNFFGQRIPLVEKLNLYLTMGPFDFSDEKKEEVDKKRVLWPSQEYRNQLKGEIPHFEEETDSQQLETTDRKKQFFSICEGLVNDPHRHQISIEDIFQTSVYRDEPTVKYLMTVFCLQLMVDKLIQKEVVDKKLDELILSLNGKPAYWNQEIKKIRRNTFDRLIGFCLEEMTSSFGRAYQIFEMAKKLLEEFERKSLIRPLLRLLSVAPEIKRNEIIQQIKIVKNSFDSELNKEGIALVISLLQRDSPSSQDEKKSTNSIEHAKQLSQCLDLELMTDDILRPCVGLFRQLAQSNPDKSKLEILINLLPEKEKKEAQLMLGSAQESDEKKRKLADFSKKLPGVKKGEFAGFLKCQIDLILNGKNTLAEVLSIKDRLFSLMPRYPFSNQEPAKTLMDVLHIYFYAQLFHRDKNYEETLGSAKVLFTRRFELPHHVDILKETVNVLMSCYNELLEDRKYSEAFGFLKQIYHCFSYKEIEPILEWLDRDSLDVHFFLEMADFFIELPMAKSSQHYLKFLNQFRVYEKDENLLVDLQKEIVKRLRSFPEIKSTVSKQFSEMASKWELRIEEKEKQQNTNIAVLSTPSKAVEQKEFEPKEPQKSYAAALKAGAGSSDTVSLQQNSQQKKSRSQRGHRHRGGRNHYRFFKPKAPSAGISDQSSQLSQERPKFSAAQAQPEAPAVQLNTQVVSVSPRRASVLPVVSTVSVGTSPSLQAMQNSQSESQLPTVLDQNSQIASAASASSPKITTLPVVSTVSIGTSPPPQALQSSQIESGLPSSSDADEQSSYEQTDTSGEAFSENSPLGPQGQDEKSLYQNTANHGFYNQGGYQNGLVEYSPNEMMQPPQVVYVPVPTEPQIIYVSVPPAPYYANQTFSQQLATDSHPFDGLILKNQQHLQKLQAQIESLDFQLQNCSTGHPNGKIWVKQRDKLCREWQSINSGLQKMLKDKRVAANVPASFPRSSVPSYGSTTAPYLFSPSLPQFNQSVGPSNYMAPYSGYNFYSQ